MPKVRVTGRNPWREGRHVTATRAALAEAGARTAHDLTKLTDTVDRGWGSSLHACRVVSAHGRGTPTGGTCQRMVET